MAVTTTTFSETYTATGAESSFAVTFRFLEDDHLVVTLDGVLLTRGTHYSVQGKGTAAGAVVPLDPFVGELVISRSIPLTQPTRFRLAGTFSPRSHEDALDRSVMQAQQVSEAVSEVSASLDQEVLDRTTDLATVKASTLAAVAAINQAGHAVTDTSSVLAFGSTTARTLTARAADVVYVADYGAVGDGTDETAELQAALDAGAGRRVVFGKPSSYYAISDTLTVGPNTEITGVGVGGVEVEVPAGASFDAFDIDGDTQVRFSGIKVRKASGAAATGYGFNVRGAATDIEFARCSATGMQRGFNVEGWNGTTPGTAERITFRQCRADSSSSSGFGFSIDNADVVLFDDCHASANGLDGFKLRRATSNVTVRGGSSVGNGVSGAGDGMDCFAGGDRFLVDGFIVESNNGSGITVKTGSLNEDVVDPENTPLTYAEVYGRVRNVLITNLRARYNTSQGLNLNISEPLVMTQPLVTSVVVMGGLFEENDQYGIYCNTRNTTIVAPHVKKNGLHGIAISTRALDVTVSNPTLIANGTAAAGTYSGISIAGTRVRVRGGRVVGVDADTIGQDSDLAAIGTVVTRYAIDVSSSASDVEVEVDSVAYVSGGGGAQIYVRMTSGRCIVHHKQDGSPATLGQGSIGSTWVNTAATSVEDILWVKAYGDPNDVAGWMRVQDTRSQYEHTDGALGYAPTAGSPSTILWTAAISASRNINLPTVSVYAGRRFRIVRTAAATGEFGVLVNNGSGGALLHVLLPSSWCEVEHDGTDWLLVGSGEFLPLETKAITNAYTMTAYSPRSVVMGTGASIGVDRDVDLPASGSASGTRVRVVRTAAATGAGSLNVKDGSTVLKALSAGQWCEAEYTGASWELVAFGSL